MKIGYPNHPRKPLFPDMEWIAESGFDFIDLFLEPDVCEPEKLNAKKIKTKLNSLSLDVIGHTPYYLPIGSPLKKLRDSGIDIFNEYLYFFKQTGCKKVTIHANWPGAMFNDEDGVKFQIESLNKIVEYADSIKMTVMYEPVNSHYDTAANVKKILSEVKNLAFHADIGHFNLNGNKPIEYLSEFKNQIEHIHLHDNNGWSDLHLPIGTGSIGWEKVIDFLKTFYDGTITLEIFSNDKDYIQLSLKKLRKKLGGK